MNAKTEQKERSHQAILTSAANLLREKGITGASVAEVMKGAGLTVGGFYAHFTSKTALIDEALLRTATQMREVLFARLEESPADDRVEVVLQRYLSDRHRDEFLRGCPLPAVVGEVGTTAPEHRETLQKQVDALSTRMEEYLPAEHAVSPRYAALGLVALMYGGLSLSRALRGTPLADEMLRACRALGVFATRGAAGQ